MTGSYMYSYSHINFNKVGELPLLNILLNYVCLKRLLNFSYIYTHIHHTDAPCLWPHILNVT